MHTPRRPSTIAACIAALTPAHAHAQPPCDCDAFAEQPNTAVADCPGTTQQLFFCPDDFTPGSDRIQIAVNIPHHEPGDPDTPRPLAISLTDLTCFDTGTFLWDITVTTLAPGGNAARIVSHRRDLERTDTFTTPALHPREHPYLVEIALSNANTGPLSINVACATPQPQPEANTDATLTTTNALAAATATFTSNNPVYAQGSIVIDPAINATPGLDLPIAVVAVVNTPLPGQPLPQSAPGAADTIVTEFCFQPFPCFLDYTDLDPAPFPPTPPTVASTLNPGSYTLIIDTNRNLTFDTPDATASFTVDPTPAPEPPDVISFNTPEQNAPAFNSGPQPLGFITVNAGDTATLIADVVDPNADLNTVTAFVDTNKNDAPDPDETRLPVAATTTDGRFIVTLDTNQLPAPKRDDTATFPIAFLATDATGRSDIAELAVDVVGPFPCPADTNNDRTVGPDDLFTVLANFGNTTANGPADGDVSPTNNPDGAVTPDDLFAVLANFGTTCPD